MQEFSVLELNPFTEEFQIVQQPYFAQELCPPSLDSYSGEQIGPNVAFSPSTGYHTLPYSPYSSPFSPNTLTYDYDICRLSPDLAYPFAGGAHQNEVLFRQLDDDARFSYEDFLRFSPEPSPASSPEAMMSMY
jgi:hypothetical protein